MVKDLKFTIELTMEVSNLKAQMEKRNCLSQTLALIGGFSLLKT